MTNSRSTRGRRGVVQKKQPEAKLICFKPTEDDWFPSYYMDERSYEKPIRADYPALLVLVSFHEFYDRSGYRVCVWGAEDYGMEKDFKKTEREEALELFHMLLAKDFINHAGLRQLGFVRA